MVRQLVEYWQVRALGAKQHYTVHTFLECVRGTIPVPTLLAKQEWIELVAFDRWSDPPVMYVFEPTQLLRLALLMVTLHRLDLQIRVEWTCGV